MKNDNESGSWFYQKAWGEFRRGETKVKLVWDGGEATVLLYDQGVERTVAAIRNALPMKLPVVQVGWSGEMLVCTRTFDIGITEHENTVRLVRPGDLALDPKFNEITVTYGTAEAKLPSGDNTLTVFGQIISGLDEFAVWARERRFVGIGELELKV